MPLIHSEVSDRLLCYLDGRLDEDQRREVREHLERCRSCSDELAALGPVVVALRDAGWDATGGGGPADRYGCPSADELTPHETATSGGSEGERGWIGRHLETCLRCQRELDLTRLMERELQRESGPVATDALFAKVEDQLLGRVRQVMGGSVPTPRRSRFLSLGSLLLTRATLLSGLAVAIGVWGLLRFHGGGIPVAQRGTGREESDVKGAPSHQTRLPGPPLAEQRPPRAPSGTPAVVAKAEPKQAPSVPTNVGPSSPSPLAVVATPDVEQKAREPVAPGMTPGLPPLVAAKQGEALGVLILPTPDRPGLRSAVARGLRERIGTIEPPDSDFPPGASVDDLAANRRLGRLFGVRYVLDVVVSQAPSGYVVVLRAADSETGGIIASRQARPASDETVEAVAARLAKEMRQELQ